MEPKPDHFGPEVASAFQDEDVVASYEDRPHYSDEVFTVLTGLIRDTPRTVLDAGCGTGFLARPLAALVDRVDAVDISPAMIAAGRSLPGGHAPNLRWIESAVEKALLDPPYALITAGDSLHWMDWAAVMPRFASLLSPHGVLAILTVDALPPPWQEELQPILRRYSVVRTWRPHNLLHELESRGLFRELGAHQTAPARLTQSVEGYIRSFHGRAGFPRRRMAAEDAAAFDQAVRALAAPYGDPVELAIVTRMAWGLPFG